MKYAVAFLASIAITSPSFAVILGTAPTVTIALTASDTIGGFKVIDSETNEISYEDQKSTDKKDKNGDIILTTTEIKMVIAVYRYGNAQLISELFSSGSLPDGEVKGWSIVDARGINSDIYGLYAVKKGQPPVYIRAEFDYSSGACASSGKYTYSPKNNIYTTISSSQSGKQSVKVTFNGFQFTGIQTSSNKFVNASFGKGNDAISYETELIGASKVAGINGTYGYPEALVEGSISIAAEAVLDLEKLGFGQ